MQIFILWMQWLLLNSLEKCFVIFHYALTHFFFHHIVLTKGRIDLSLWLLFFFINIKGNNSILFKFLGQSFSFICYFSWQNINSWAAHVQLMFDLWHNATLIVPNLFSVEDKHRKTKNSRRLSHHSFKECTNERRLNVFSV